MLIGIDISQIAHSGTGVARYTENLIKALVIYDKENSYVFFFSSLRKKIPQDIRKLILQKHKLIEYILPPTLLDLLWNRLHIYPIENLVGEVDLFVTSDWTEPPAKNAKKTTIIHDLVIYKYPQTSTNKTTINLSGVNISPNIVSVQKKKLDWVANETSLVIADSYSTKKDIIEILKIDGEKIKVIYPAVEVCKPKQEVVFSTLKKYNLSAPFILTVGKLEPRKNIQRLVNAFNNASINNLQLVIAGTMGWDNHINTDSPNIHLLGFVSDNELYSLYSKAEFFVMPSLYEGFGYPVVEAMTLGCPVAASNTSSLRELVGENGLLFNPLSEKNIQETIERLHKDCKLRNKLSNRGKNIRSKYSSKRFAEQLKKYFSSVC